MAKRCLIVLFLFVSTSIHAQNWTVPHALNLIIAADSGLHFPGANTLTVYMDTNTGGSISWTISGKQGASNTFLRNDGSGHLTWAAAGVGSVTSVDVSGGLTGLSFTGGPITSSGTITMGGLLTVPYGGTGFVTANANGILYGNGASTLQVTSPGSAGQVLTGHGSGTPPDFQNPTAAVDAVITDPGSSLRNLITPTHDTIVPITANIAHTSSKHIQNWDIDSVTVAYIASDGSFSTTQNVTAGQALTSLIGEVNLGNGTLDFDGIGLRTWNLPDSSGTIALLQNIPSSGTDTSFVRRWPTTTAQNTITTLDTTIVPLTIAVPVSQTGHYLQIYNGATLADYLDVNGTSGKSLLSINGIIQTTGSGVNADINGNYDINAARNLSADSSLLLIGAYGTGTLAPTGFTANRTYLLPDVSGTLVPLNALSVGNAGAVLYGGSSFTSSSGALGYVLTAQGTGVLPIWTSPGGSFILNQYTAQTNAGFNISAGAPAKTLDFTEATILNDATSSTNSIAKTGLSIASTGTWTGTTAPNYGLKFNVSGGTTPTDINGTGGNWYVTAAGDALTHTINTTQVILPGSSSGSALLTVPAAAGSSTRFQIPGNNGMNGYFLQTDGSGNLSWAAGGTGTVTSIFAGNGLNGGTITTTGTIALNLAHANTWTAKQTFNSDVQCSGSGSWLIGTASSITGSAQFYTSSNSNAAIIGSDVLTNNAMINFPQIGAVTGKFVVSDNQGTSGQVLISGGTGARATWSGPSIGTTTNDGVGVTSSSAAGKDLAGIITFTTALNVAGGYVEITFGTAYAAAPVVVVGPGSNAPLSGNVISAVTSTTTKFRITFSATVAETNVAINYIVIN